MAAVEKRLEMLFQAGPRLRNSFTSTSRKKTAPQDLDQGIQKRKARTRMSSASQTTSGHFLLKTLVCEVSTLCFHAHTTDSEDSLKSIAPRLACSVASLVNDSPSHSPSLRVPTEKWSVLLISKETRFCKTCEMSDYDFE